MKSVKINVSLASIYEGLRAGLPTEGEFSSVKLSRDGQSLEVIYSSEMIVHSYDFPVDVDDYRKLVGGKLSAPPVVVAAKPEPNPVIADQTQPEPDPSTVNRTAEILAKVSPRFKDKAFKK